MQISSKLWTDAGLYKGKIFPSLPCLWFNLEKLTANHFVSSEVLFNASPEANKKTPNPKQPLLTPEIFSWQTVLICSLTAQKPLLSVQFSNNIFPGLTRWQSGIILHLCCFEVCAKSFKLSKPACDSWYFLFCKCLSHKGLGINIPYLREGNDGEDNNARVNLERCWENDETELAPLGWRAPRSRDFVMYTLE